MLAECPALTHVNLGVNRIYGAAGAERLGGVLAQWRALAILDLDYNRIGADGAEIFAGVMAQ